MGEDEDRKEHGVMYVALGDYLQKQKTLESTKPKAERRKVPSVAALARALDVDSLTLRNIINNKVKLLNLDTGAALIAELRRQGFDVDVGDLLAYRPPE